MPWLVCCCCACFLQCTISYRTIEKLRTSVVKGVDAERTQKRKRTHSDLAKLKVFGGRKGIVSVDDLFCMFVYFVFVGSGRLVGLSQGGELNGGMIVHVTFL